MKIKMNNSILDTSKIMMFEFWHDYIKWKYQDNTKLCYMDTERFISHIKTEDIYEDITDDGEKTSLYIKLWNR